MTTVQEAKELICELCAEYYKQGWVSGTGGGMSIQVADGSGTIVMAPSGSSLGHVCTTCSCSAAAG